MRSVLSLTLFSLVFLAQQASASLMGTDVLLRDGTAYSMDTEGNRHSAIAIAGDQILAIGSEADVSIFKIEATRIVELDGRVVFPGFIDTHIHTMDTLPVLNGAMLSPGGAPKRSWKPQSALWSPERKPTSWCSIATPISATHMPYTASRLISPCRTDDWCTKKNINESHLLRALAYE